MEANSAPLGTYYITTFGCQMNEHDSEKIAGMVERMGYRIVPDEIEGKYDGQICDLIVFNTCCIRQGAEDRAFGNIGALKPLKKKNKEWRKKHLDWADNRSSITYDLVRKTVLHKKINYDLVNGKLHMDDLKLILNPSDVQAAYIPEKIQHYPIMNSKMNVLRGEEAKRVFDYRVIVTNPNAITEIENNKKEEEKLRKQQEKLEKHAECIIGNGHSSKQHRNSYSIDHTGDASCSHHPYQFIYAGKSPDTVIQPSKTQHNYADNCMNRDIPQPRFYISRVDLRNLTIKAHPQSQKTCQVHRQDII